MPYDREYYDEEGEDQGYSLTPPSEDDAEGEGRYWDKEDDYGEYRREQIDESEKESEDEQTPREELSDNSKEHVRRIAVDARARAEKGILRRLQMEGEGFERLQMMMQKRAGRAAPRALRPHGGVSEEGLRLRQFGGVLSDPQHRAISLAMDANERARSQELAEARAYAAKARDLLQHEDFDDNEHMERESWSQKPQSRPLRDAMLRTLLIMFGIISMIVILWNSKHGSSIEAARIAPPDNLLGLESATRWDLDSRHVAQTSAAIESIYEDAKAVFVQVDHDKDWLEFSSDLYRLSHEYLVDAGMMREQPSLLGEGNVDFLTGQKQWLQRLIADLDGKLQRWGGYSWIVSLWDFWVTVLPIPGSYELTSLSSVAHLLRKHVRVQESVLGELVAKNHDLEGFLKGAKMRREGLCALIEVELENWEMECKAQQEFPVVPGGAEQEEDRSPYCKWTRPDEIRRMLGEVDVMTAFGQVKEFVESNRARYEEVGRALKQTAHAAEGVKGSRVYKSVAHPKQLGYVMWIRERIGEEQEMMSE